jgi:putative intracellular protease/amidase
MTFFHRVATIPSGSSLTALSHVPTLMTHLAGATMKHLVIISILLMSTRMVGQTHAKRVAFLISDGVLVLDYTSAYEVFGQAGMRVFTVAKEMDTVRLSSNMRVIPNYSIANCPDPDVLVIPTSDEDTAIVRWIKSKAEKAEYILTICGGVYPVYAAGLLDGLSATTYGPLIDHFKEHATRARVVTDRRFVDNGRVITTGSYASGIDAALHIVSKMYGEPRAQEVANNIEYQWDKEYTYVRTKLADNWLAPLYDFSPPLRGKTLKYEGNERYWVAEYETERKESLKEFATQIPEMAEMHHWTNIGITETDTTYSAKWVRKDFDNREWLCTITIRRTDRQTYSLAYEIGLRD